MISSIDIASSFLATLVLNVALYSACHFKNLAKMLQCAMCVREAYICIPYTDYRKLQMYVTLGQQKWTRSKHNWYVFIILDLPNSKFLLLSFYMFCLLFRVGCVSCFGGKKILAQRTVLCGKIFALLEGFWHFRNLTEMLHMKRSPDNITRKGCTQSST